MSLIAYEFITIFFSVYLEQSDIMSIEEVAIISIVTTFLVAFVLGAAAMVHCRSSHQAEPKAAKSGNHLTMESILIKREKQSSSS